MSGLQSMSLWLLGAGALALGLWVVRRQLRRRNYWIAYGLIAILVGIALLDWVIKLSFGKWLHQEIFAYVPVVWSFRDKLTLAAFATGIGAIWTLVQIWLAFKKRQSEKLNSNTGSADLNNRRDMLKMVRARWITGFLEKSLSKTQLDVGLVEIPDALVRLDILSRISGQPSTRVPAGTPILQIFNEHAEQLLILGAPGAGKTTLLLKLTRDLLSRAEKMDTDRIPVIFPLSTWSTHQPPLADWLIAELCQSYRVPKKVAEGWVTNNQILPLLDGLDEVRQECRQACVAAINKYRRTKGPSTMAVCCREFDYKAIAYNLELEGAVLVQPLARAEVSTYLEKLGEPMAGVRQLLRDDQTLWELLNTPLMVDTVTRAYQNQPVESLKVLWGLQERRNHLFKAYVDRMFQHRGSNGRYQREQTLYWLSWLADQLFKHNMTDFYIERLQVDWLPPRMQRLSMWVGGLVVGLVYGLVGGLVGGLVAVLVVGPRAGLVAGLRAGLVAGLRAGLVVGLVGGLVGGVSGPIQPVETIRWSPKKVLKTTREDLV